MSVTDVKVVKKMKLVILPSDLLRTSSRKIGLITPEIKLVIRAMEKVTLDWEDNREHEVGVALAAIQVDQPLRLIIVRNNFNDKQDRGFKVFINPVITKYEGDIETDYEGCLSIQDIYGKVPRYKKVRVKATNLEGKEVRFSVDGFLARIFQHEIDHTNGKLFIDHIKNDKEAFYRLLPDGKLEALDYDKDVKNSPILW